MKYAVLHFSYSAPVLVSVITDEVSSIAARDTTGVWLRTATFVAARLMLFVLVGLVRFIVVLGREVNVLDIAELFVGVLVLTALLLITV